MLGDSTLVSTVNGTILPGLKKLGVKVESTGFLTVGSTTDTAAAQDQLESFIERWKTEHVDTVFLSSYRSRRSSSSPSSARRCRTCSCSPTTAKC